MTPTKQKLTFSAAYEELQQITREFETGELDLEKSIPKFKQATQIVKFLQSELKKMETQIEEINLDNEAVGKIPLDRTEPKSARAKGQPDGPDQTEIPF